MPDVSSRGIFLSYRRQETTAYARLLEVELKRRFPDAKVFMDVDSIEAGVDFREAIRQAVRSCAVLVALIGPQWATLKGERRRRRLDDPDDVVRFELWTALDHYVRVIPVLVDGARPLRSQELPSGLQRLARLNALELSNARYQHDADQLFGLIQQMLNTPEGQGELPGLEWRVRAAEQARDAAGARDAYADLARERGRALGPEDPATLAARANLARMTAAAGNAAGAREQYDALLPLYERVLGREHLETLTLRNGQAHATLAGEGNLYSAIQMYADLFYDARGILGEDHPFTQKLSEGLYVMREVENEARRTRQPLSRIARIDWFGFKH